jgi:hypothetical protein
VKAALQAGHSVRALARSARRIPVDHPKLEKMAGDALEMAMVKRALTGAPVAWRFGQARNHPQADAMFNLALLLQRNNKHAEAVEYWQRYLANDAQSEWAQARRFLKFCEMQLRSSK